MNRILLCKHCGNKTSHTILEEVIEREDISTNVGEEFSIDIYLMFTRCDNCGRHSLFYCIEGDYEESSCLWPYQKHLNESVPKEIRTAYSEAIKIKKLSKVAFLIMIRRSLDILCKHEKGTGIDLYNKIENLGVKSIIPQKLGEMANLIRLLGNESAHDSNMDITDHEIDLLDEFFIAPQKISNLKEKLGKK